MVCSSWTPREAHLTFCPTLIGANTRFLIVIIGKKTKVESREKKVESSAWLARLGAPARQNRRAYIEAGMNHETHEKHERGNNRTTNGHEWDTNIFFQGRREKRVESSAWLARLGAPANGSPLQSVRALPSTFFSLLSTYRTLTHSLSLASLSIITLRILTMSTVSFGGMGTIRSLKNLRMTSTWFSKKSVTCGTAL